MNLKAAHLISVQFGIFVGVAFSLVVFHFENSRPRTATAQREPAAERAAAAEPLSQPEDQPGDNADNDDADADLAELAAEPPRTPLPNEYSPEAVERYRAEATRLYYEQIAPRHPPITTVAPVAPAYTEAVEEPAVNQAYDPVPETVAYVQPAQVIVYPQPAQFVVFSQRNRHANRCRPGFPAGTFASNPNRRPDGRAMHAAIAHHANPGGSACPSPQGSASRGKH
jgi:MFS superfamily sulfate permease-like transporter